MSRILVLFHSQQAGNTAAMAGAIAEGAKAAGAEVKQVNTNEERLDIEAYRSFDAAAFGTPDYYSYLAGGLKMFLDDWYIAKQKDPNGLIKKPYGLFYSHGGGGAVRGPLEKLFKGLGAQVGQTVESERAPDEETLAACRELGRQLAQAVGR